MARTKRNSAKNRAKSYGFSEFLDFPERVQETILYNLCRKILDTVDNYNGVQTSGNVL
jgi:hypothetical protein